jgi:hypothetical protein
MKGRDLLQKVKPSYYKAPNIFSEMHRKLPKHLCMSDLDYLQFCLGEQDYILDGEDRLYAEYKISADKHAQTTAIFDFKYDTTEWLKNEMKERRVGTSIWYQTELSEKIGCKFYIVCAKKGQLPLNFYQVTTAAIHLVGTLTDSSPKALECFWRNNLKLTN